MLIKSMLRPLLVLFGLLAILTGLLYPALITAAAQLLFPYQAGGSLLTRDGQVTGSALIGQQFDDPRYFWGRLSATAGQPYNASNSGGSNRSVLNPDLLAAAQARIAALRQADPGNQAAIPVDLVTASASGLDPHISPAAAFYQAGRVARLRGLPLEQVNALITRFTEGRVLGILGEPRVNVLELNLALDGLK